MHYRVTVGHEPFRPFFRLQIRKLTEGLESLSKMRDWAAGRVQIQGGKSPSCCVRPYLESLLGKKMELCLGTSVIVLTDDWQKYCHGHSGTSSIEIDKPLWMLTLEEMYSQFDIGGYDYEVDGRTYFAVTDCPRSRFLEFLNRVAAAL